MCSSRRPRRPARALNTASGLDTTHPPLPTRVDTGRAARASWRAEQQHRRAQGEAIRPLHPAAARAVNTLRANCCTLRRRTRRLPASPAPSTRSFRRSVLSASRNGYSQHAVAGWADDHRLFPRSKGVMGAGVSIEFQKPAPLSFSLSSRAAFWNAITRSRMAGLGWD
jgi:hypothetical protein